MQRWFQRWSSRPSSSAADFLGRSHSESPFLLRTIARSTNCFFRCCREELTLDRARYGSSQPKLPLTVKKDYSAVSPPWQPQALQIPSSACPPRRHLRVAPPTRKLARQSPTNLPPAAVSVRRGAVRVRAGRTVPPTLGSLQRLATAGTGGPARGRQAAQETDMRARAGSLVVVTMLLVLLASRQLGL